MDFDLFFSSPRWKILEILANNPSSPLEISEKLKTTVSYVSQQLKLLEAASLVKKEKTGLVEKGKPRTIFSISKEILQFNALIKKFPARKIIRLTEHHKTILKIWLLEDSNFHYMIEKFYWSIENDLKHIKGIFIDISQKKPKIVVVSDVKKISVKINSFLKDIHEEISCSLISLDELIKYPKENIHPIYDPSFLLENKSDEKLKGGS